MKINPRSIAILMAAYNSEKYLGQQIDSIMGQTETDWTLYIRDDGSSDSTYKVIEEYESLYPERIVVLRDNMGNLGCRDNFFAVLEAVQSKYYMFSDADDVWLPDKIRISYETIINLEKDNPDKAIIVHTDMSVTDDKLCIIHPSMWRAGKFNPDKLKSYEYLAIHGYVGGATMIFNQEAKEASFPLNRDVYMHDLWIGLCTIKNGIIASIHQPTVLYRQHAHNMAGGAMAEKLKLKYKLKNIGNVISSNLSTYKMLKKIGYGSFAKYIYYKTKLVLMMRSGKMFE